MSNDYTEADVEALARALDPMAFERPDKLHLAMRRATATEYARVALRAGYRLPDPEHDARVRRAALGEVLAIAETSEKRAAEAYDRIVKARDLVGAENPFPWHALQEAKYLLGGRVNVAAAIRALVEKQDAE